MPHSAPPVPGDVRRVTLLCAATRYRGTTGRRSRRCGAQRRPAPRPRALALVDVVIDLRQLIAGQVPRAERRGEPIGPLGERQLAVLLPVLGDLDLVDRLAVPQLGAG